jgi:hypothetical protein
VSELGNISPSQGTLFWGIQDLNGDCGSSGFEWLELPAIDISGFQDVICRIDYQVIGYDAGDDIELEPWFDGQPQERMILVDGASDFSTPGWVEATVEIPNRISEFKLRVYVKQNGTDQAGIDNIRLEGLPIRVCSSLMISEYVEGTSSTDHRNTFVEIYNPSEKEVDLTGYELVKYTGSNLLPSSTLVLQGSLGPYETFLIEDERETLDITADLSTNSSVMDFNGDDKVGLQFNGQSIDIVGIVGDSLEFGKDITLRRKSRVQNPNTEFDRGEWDTYGPEQTDDLNRHQSYCMGAVPEIEVAGLGSEIPDGKMKTQIDDNTYFGYLDTASSESVSHAFVIKNTGTSDLEISSVRIEGLHRSDYMLEEVADTSLGIKDSLLIHISFSPLESGIRNARLVIENSDPSEASYEFLLQGEGTSSTDSPLMITTYYEGESNNRWIEVTNTSGSDILENSFYLALFRQDLLNAPINTKPSVKKAIPFMPAGATLKFRATLNVSEPAYALDGSEITTGVCGFNGDDVLVISSSGDETCWANRVDLVGRKGDWGVDVAYIRKYGCRQEGPNTGFNSDHWWPFSTAEIDAAQPGVNLRLGEYFTGETRFISNQWSNGLPDMNRNAVLQDDFSLAQNGELRSCNLIVEKGAHLTVEEGHHIAIRNDLQVAGTLEIMHGGELLIINNSGRIENSGSILMHRESSTLEPHDYTFWSSPVRSAELMTVFKESDPNSIFSFSTPIFTDKDLDGEDDNGDAWVKATGDMLPGKGYAVMAPKILPADMRQRVTFVGEPNNGFVNVPIEIQEAPNDGSNWNLIGNPYPSAVDAERILSHPENVNLIGGTFYFWTHNTRMQKDPNKGTGAYSSDDYAMYTAGTGGIRATSGGVTPGQYISVGQGFFVEAFSEGVLRLDNEMRIAGKAPHFFKQPRNTKQKDEDKVWLNLFNDEGAFSQILVGFLEGASEGYDNRYDGKRFSANRYVDFYSTLDSLDLAIRGEPLFHAPKEIPLGMAVKTDGIDSLSISIDRLSGQLNHVEIHLLDQLTGISHDLKESSYRFRVSNKGVIKDRFTLILGPQSPTDVSVESQVNGIIWFLEREDIVIRTRRDDILRYVRLYDLLGRMVIELSPGQRVVRIPSGRFASNSVYVLQVYLTSGEAMTTKILHLRT